MAACVFLGFMLRATEEGASAYNNFRAAAHGMRKHVSQSMETANARRNKRGRQAGIQTESPPTEQENDHDKNNPKQTSRNRHKAPDLPASELVFNASKTLHKPKQQNPFGNGTHGGKKKAIVQPPVSYFLTQNPRKLAKMLRILSNVAESNPYGDYAVIQVLHHELVEPAKNWICCVKK
jgi:hypothetical protein